MYCVSANFDIDHLLLSKVVERFGSDFVLLMILKDSIVLYILLNYIW